MLADCVAQHHGQRGERRGGEQERDPNAERQQDCRHGHQRDGVLNQAAEVLDQSDGAIVPEAASAMQAIVKLGRVVKSQVDFDGLALDQRRDVIADQLGLRGTRVIGGGAKNFSQQQQRAKRNDQHEGGAERGPIAVRAHGGCERVDYGARQVNRRHREEALHQQQGNPDRGPAAGSGPHQREGVGEIRELPHRLADLRADDLGTCGHRGAVLRDAKRGDSPQFRVVIRAAAVEPAGESGSRNGPGDGRDLMYQGG